MKKINLMWGILVLAVVYAGEGFCAQIKELSVERTTYLGPKHEDFGGGFFHDSEEFRYERGTLHCKEGFIPDISYGITERVGSQDGPFPESDAEELKAVSGLYLISLNSYVMWAKRGSLKCFPRSAESYSLDGVPYVAVADRPGAIPGPLPYASVGAVAAETTEGGAPAQFLVALNRAYGKPVVLQFTIGGTARNGQDYKKLKLKLTIPAGNLSTTVVIVPKRDRKAEGTETVVLTLKPNKKYGISSQASATVTISDAP